MNFVHMPAFPELACLGIRFALALMALSVIGSCFGVLPERSGWL
jgi:hypothetical protein